MVRRNWFEHHEAAEIKGLIDELHGDDDATRMTHGDFDDLVHRGRIRIVDDPAAGVAIETDDDEAFWSQQDGTIAVRDRDGARCGFPSAA